MNSISRQLEKSLARGPVPRNDMLEKETMAKDEAIPLGRKASRLLPMVQPTSSYGNGRKKPLSNGKKWRYWSLLRFSSPRIIALSTG